MEQMFKLSEIASVLGVTSTTVMRYIKSGKLKGQMVGHRWRVTESDLRAFIDEATKEALARREQA